MLQAKAIDRTAAADPIQAQLARLIAAADSPFLVPPPAGYKRGIDFYTASSLVRVMATAATLFRKAHGRWPDILDPRNLSDKIFWSQFFRPLKVPEAGNKLMTGHFLTDEVRAAIDCPAVVWQSAEARVPRGGEVAPGAYYLKTSHGSNMFRRIVYPISDAEADALDAEFAQYLLKSYGMSHGEWWYNSFAPRLMLEQAVGSAEYTVTWNFYVIGGEVALAVAFHKTADGQRKLYLTPDFEPSPGQPAGLALADFGEPSAAVRATMLEAARAIGRPLGFVRVDFLLDDDQKPYLNEITFSPGAGLGRLPAGLDQELGRKWDLDAELAAIGEAAA